MRRIDQPSEPNTPPPIIVPSEIGPGYEILGFDDDRVVGPFDSRAFAIAVVAQMKTPRPGNRGDVPEAGRHAQSECTQMPARSTHTEQAWPRRRR